ncbi:MAG TPA: cytochrome c [Terriglobales bacterium]|nr:cytochrome c [Terriglobales bacterium]
MLKHLLIMLLLGLSALAQESQAPSKSTPPPSATSIPVEATRQANPVKPTPESLAVGKKWYNLDCAMCHGTTGDGKGEMASDMKQKLVDFTDPAALKDVTDGEMFYVIKNGKGQMPAEGDRVKAEQAWDLVNYVRSLAKKAPAPAADKPAN